MSTEESLRSLELVAVWFILFLDWSGEDRRHPAFFVKADSKGVTDVTVCNYRFQRSCGDGFFVT